VLKNDKIQLRGLQCALGGGILGLELIISGLRLVERRLGDIFRLEQSPLALHIALGLLQGSIKAGQIRPLTGNSGLLNLYLGRLSCTTGLRGNQLAFPIFRIELDQYGGEHGRVGVRGALGDGGSLIVRQRHDACGDFGADFHIAQGLDFARGADKLNQLSTLSMLDADGRWLDVSFHFRPDHHAHANDHYHDHENHDQNNNDARLLHAKTFPGRP